MSLDIRFEWRKKICCPKCGEVAGYINEQTIESSGRGWYPILESLGYYKSDGKDEWYGKDMRLTAEQALNVAKIVRKADLYRGGEIRNLIAMAIMENDTVVVNADW